MIKNLSKALACIIIVVLLLSNVYALGPVSQAASGTDQQDTVLMPKSVGNSVRIVQKNSASKNQNIVVSANGNYSAAITQVYNSGTHQYDFMLQIQDKSGKVVTTVNLNANTMFDSAGEVSFSPDGTKIAVVMNGTATDISHPSTLTVCDLKGNKLSVLTGLWDMKYTMDNNFATVTYKSITGRQDGAGHWVLGATQTKKIAISPNAAVSADGQTTALVVSPRKGIYNLEIRNVNGGLLSTVNMPSGIMPSIIDKQKLGEIKFNDSGAVVVRMIGKTPFGEYNTLTVCDKTGKVKVMKVAGRISYTMDNNSITVTSQKIIRFNIFKWKYTYGKPITEKIAL